MKNNASSELTVIDSADLAHVQGGAGEGETWEKTLGNVGTAAGSGLGGLLTAPLGGISAVAGSVVGSVAGGMYGRSLGRSIDNPGPPPTGGVSGNQIGSPEMMAP